MPKDLLNGKDCTVQAHAPDKAQFFGRNPSMQILLTKPLNCAVPMPGDSDHQSYSTHIYMTSRDMAKEPHCC